MDTVISILPLLHDEPEGVGYQGMGAWLIIR